MNLPSISCLCCTYGRHERLREALACFVNQDYPNKELIILNTFPEQQYICDEPYVKVINLPKRPSTLGAMRNLAASESSGEILMLWDDDDLWLPHHLQIVGSTFAKRPDLDWVHVQPTFYAEKFKIREVFKNWMNSVAYRHSAWLKVGGYPEDMNVGEDAAFLGRLSSKTKGAKLDLSEHEIASIYSWNNDVWHVSGNGPDDPNKISSIDKLAKDVENRVFRLKEPLGKIMLTPNLEHDPAQMKAEYLKRIGATIAPDSVCVVQLGRYGDIVNILPCLLHIHNNYGKPYLMVSKEFAPLLEGISYVQPFLVDLTNDKLREALVIARKKFKIVINAQIWGRNWEQEKKTPAYNMESWRMLGFLPWFTINNMAEEREWLPFFDRLNYERASAALAKLRRTNKPFILCNLTQSVSSPFPHGAEVQKTIVSTFGDEYEIIDVAGLRLTAIYDLIPIIAEAALVVSCDSSLMHLAAATSTPVLPFINPIPWQGSWPRCYAPVGTVSYTVMGINNALDCIRSKVSECLEAEKKEFGLAPKVISAPARRIFHVVERHVEKDIHEAGRKAMAQESWKTLYKQGVIPRYYSVPYRRDARALGDKRDLPYLKDVLEHGMVDAEDHDIIMFSNDDNWLHPELPNIVRYHCANWGAVCSQRCEFKSGPFPVGKGPEEFAKRGELHMGRDIFAFTKKWLVTHWQDIPDFLLGASEWDLCMCATIRLTWGIKTNVKNLWDSIYPAELPRGYVSHKYHKPKWTEKDNINDAPSQIYNRKLFKAWAHAHPNEFQFTPESTI